MTARRRALVHSLLLAAAAAALFSSGACQKNKPAPGASGTPGYERRPYTPIPPPPTRTLKPGEPTPPPTLPG